MVEPALVDQEARRHVLLALASGPGIGWDGPARAVFEERFDRHFPILFRLFHALYGSRPDLAGPADGPRDCRPPGPGTNGRLS